MGVIDFTGMPKRNKAYAGANGKKISVLYGEEKPGHELQQQLFF